MQSNDFPTVYRWHKTWLLILQQEYDHEAPVLSSLHWLPVCFRIDFKVLLLHPLPPLPPLPPRLPGVPLSLICALDCRSEDRCVRAGGENQQLHYITIIKPASNTLLFPLAHTSTLVQSVTFLAIIWALIILSSAPVFAWITVLLVPVCFSNVV